MTEPAPVPKSSTANAPILFEDLNAPEPVDPTPPVGARWLGFVAVIVSGLLGGMIGYGTGDLMTMSAMWAIVGMIVGAGVAAVGVGVMVSLTLRAMNEWETAQHPEAQTKPRQQQIRPLSVDRVEDE